MLATLRALRWSAALPVLFALPLAAALLAPPAAADGTVAKVFVFNGGANNEGKPGDVFASGAQGWIFQSMSLLGTNGEPPTLNGDDLMQGTMKVGKVLRDANNKIIGYESDDQKTRAYNVDTSATTLDAWNALSNSGEFVVAKHGLNGGGAITLDGGTLYDGFKESGATRGGTGQGSAAGPYVLPGKPGGTVTFDCNGCYTDADPPGNGTKVKDSAEDIDGVNMAKGNVRIVYKGVGPALFGTEPQRAAAMQKLEAAAKKAGFVDDMGDGDPSGWISSLPFPDQHSTATAAIAGTGATVILDYFKDQSCNQAGAAGGCYYAPLESIGASGGDVFFQVGPGYPFLQLTVPPGALATPVAVQLGPVSPDSPQVPPGQRPLSHFGRVHRYGLDPALGFLSPALLRLGYDNTSAVTGVYQVLAGGVLAPVSASVDPSGFVDVPITGEGTYVVLGPVPAPIPTLPEWGLILLGVALAGLGARHVARTRAATATGA